MPTRSFRPPRLDAVVPPGTPVRVYRNLRPGVPTWSIQAKVRLPGTNFHGWRVMGHAFSLVLDRVTFRVYEAGRKRVLRTGVKNVHAYALGTLVQADQTVTVPEGATEAVYHPRKYPHFFAPDLRDAHVDGADRVYLSATGRVYVQ